MSATLDRDYQEGGDHYTRLPIQPWDVVDCWPINQRLGFYRGCAQKYIMRMGTKGSEIEDAKKARHYLEKLISVLEED